MEEIKTKHCPKCGRDLPLDKFGNKKAAKDGKQTWCKECCTAATLSARARRKAAAEAPAPEATKPEPEPVPTAPVPAYLVTLSDAALLGELARRGYRGRLTIEREISVGK